ADAAIDEPVRLDPGDVFAIEMDAAALGRQKAADGLDERRLARAVESDQPRDPAGVDAQVDLAQHVNILRVAGGHVAQLEQRGGFAHRGAPSPAANSKPVAASPSAGSPR